MMEAHALPDQSLSEVALPDGTTLLGDQFTVTSSLSAGGFGITYRAMDNVLGRTVVIKECFADDFCLRSGKNVLARNQAYSEHFRSTVEMFMREARSLAKLRHPNIVGVHRAFEENGTAYMALDLINGEDLHDILETSAATLTPTRVIEMLHRLLDAVEMIHDHDLLHRDISPDNVMVEKDGNPVLIDFGAARGDASRRTRAVSSLLVVKDGYSPQEFYMAGSIQTPSSDLYALAATFYHVLSGQAPPNSQIRMVEIAGENPDPCVPLAGRIKGYDPAFLAAIDQAMQALPRERLQSAAQWRDMISHSRPQSVAHPAPTTKEHAVTRLLSQPRSKPASRKPTAQTGGHVKQSISKLVQETNEEVRKSRMIIVPQKPKTRVMLPQDTSPSWVDEFNQDTVSVAQAKAARKRSVEQQLEEIEGPIEPMDLMPTSAVVRSDWVNLAREKRASSAGAQQTAQPAMATQTLDRFGTPEPVHQIDLQLETYPNTLPVAQVVGPLFKYLTTGIVLGLALILFYIPI